MRQPVKFISRFFQTALFFEMVFKKRKVEYTSEACGPSYADRTPVLHGGMEIDEQGASSTLLKCFIFDGVLFNVTQVNDLQKKLEESSCKLCFHWVSDVYPEMSEGDEPYAYFNFHGIMLTSRFPLTLAEAQKKFPATTVVIPVLADTMHTMQAAHAHYLKFKSLKDQSAVKIE